MRPVILCMTLLCAFYLNAQGGSAVDFTEGEVHIEIIPEDQRIEGEVTYDFRVLHDVDSVGISARDLEIRSVTLKGREVEHYVQGNTLVLKMPLKPGNYRGLTIAYLARPKKAVYFPGWSSAYPSEDSLLVSGAGGKQVWTQGQGKYTSSWLPSFDDMNEKVKFNLEIVYPSEYQVIANGVLRRLEPVDGNKTLWRYEMKKPASSYLLAFVAGNYKKKELRSSSGVPVELYYYPTDSSSVVTTYRYTREIFDFLEKEIGLAYPWVNYKQVPVRDFLYAGMENVTLTIFSDQYITDTIGFTDRNYVNVNAHELAHHWFGDLVTEESGKHHWLQEGFATYYALLAEKEIFGTDHYYWKIYNSAKQLISLSDQGQGESLLNPEAGSLTFYEKGAWALHVLRERIGDRAFRAAVKEYLQTYAFKNATTEQFLEVVGKYTMADLKDFRETWLEDTEFPGEEALRSLTNNSFISAYMEIERDTAPPVVVFNEYLNHLKSDVFYPVKQLITARSSAWPSRYRDSLWSFALNYGDVYMRQGVALAADSIGVYLKPQFETLLDDPSYVTVQEALVKLWMEFPKGRKEYLERTENLAGFQDHSLRIVWLALSLFTNDDPQAVQKHFNELSAYTGPGYHFEIRQQAFNMLFETRGFTRRSLLNLIQGMEHPAWQFSRFCRNMTDHLLSDPDTRMQLKSIIPGLREPIRKKLETRLEETVSGTNKS